MRIGRYPAIILKAVPDSWWISRSDHIIKSRNLGLAHEPDFQSASCTTIVMWLLLPPPSDAHLLLPVGWIPGSVVCNLVMVWALPASLYGIVCSYCVYAVSVVEDRLIVVEDFAARDGKI